jgi:hypothetical protein
MSPSDVQVLPGRVGVLHEDLLGPRAEGAQALGPGCLCGGLEERERARRVDRAALEVPGVRAATNAAVAQRSATTAGESEARVCSQEEQAVGSGVGSKATKDEEFTRSTSADRARGRLGRQGGLPEHPGDEHRSTEPLAQVVVGDGSRSNPSTPTRSRAAYAAGGCRPRCARLPSGVSYLYHGRPRSSA